MLNLTLIGFEAFCQKVSVSACGIWQNAE